MDETDVNGPCFGPVIHTRDLRLIYHLSLSFDISAPVITVTRCVAVRPWLQLHCTWPLNTCTSSALLLNKDAIAAQGYTFFTRKTIQR